MSPRFLAKKFGLVAFLGLAAAGCATLNNGRVASVVSDKEAEFTVKDGYVKAGDKVALNKPDCSAGHPGRGRRCPDMKIGTGTVASVSGNKARIKADGNAKITDDVTFEPIGR